MTLRRSLLVAALFVSILRMTPAPAETVLASCGNPTVKLRYWLIPDGTSHCNVPFTLTGTYPIAVKVDIDLSKMTYGSVYAEVEAGVGGVHPCPGDDSYFESCGYDASRDTVLDDGEPTHYVTTWNMNPGTFKLQGEARGYGGWGLTLTLA